MSLDPRFTAIIAAAGAAATTLSPQGATLATTLTALLQATSDFQAGIAAGSVTEEELATMLSQVDANLAGLSDDIAATKS